MTYYKTKWGWTDQIHLRSLSSGESMGHTQGIIRNKQKNVALVSYIQVLYQVYAVKKKNPWRGKVFAIFLFHFLMKRISRTGEAYVQRTKITSLPLGCLLILTYYFYLFFAHLSIWVTLCCVLIQAYGHMQISMVCLSVCI